MTSYSSRHRDKSCSGWAVTTFDVQVGGLAVRKKPKESDGLNAEDKLRCECVCTRGHKCMHAYMCIHSSTGLFSEDKSCLSFPASIYEVNQALFQFTSLSIDRFFHLLGPWGVSRERPPGVHVTPRAAQCLLRTWEQKPLSHAPWSSSFSHWLLVATALKEQLRGDLSQFVRSEFETKEIKDK